MMEIGRKKRFRSKVERRQIVEETLNGTSVSLVARAHNVNANQVFFWRRQYREGLLDVAEPSNALLPVTVSDATEKRHFRQADSKAAEANGIQIELGHARVRIEGKADPECIRAALEVLLR
jgi:transposase